MRSVSRRLVLGFLAAATLVGCPEPATELVVWVHVDPALAATLEPVTLEVTRDGGTQQTTFDASSVGAVFTLGVRHRAGALGPVTLEARSRAAGAVVVDRVVTSFVRGEQRLVELSLRAACVGAPCGPGMVCEETGRCVSDERPGADLPVFDPSVLVDAGSGPPGSTCLFSVHCASQERCALVGGARACVPLGDASLGQGCTADDECASGVCLTELGASAVCSRSCNSNDDCTVSSRCVADERTGQRGACVPDGACPGCDGPDDVCVLRYGAGPLCTSPLCAQGADCVSGAPCTVLVDSRGGQGSCIVEGACGLDELRFVDGSGTSRCSDGTVCDPALGDCFLGYDDCAPATELGVPASRADGLGLCVAP